MVDVKMTNGDIAVDSAGCAETVRGADALFRRAVIRLTVPKGSFIYDRELGALRQSGDPQRTELLFAEALVQYPGTRVRVLAMEGGSVSVQINIGGESRTEEVLCYGNV